MNKTVFEKFTNFVREFVSRMIADMRCNVTVLTIHDRISVALCSVEEVKRIPLLANEQMVSLVGATLDFGLGPLPIGDIFNFTVVMKKLLCSNRNVVICVETNDPELITIAAWLVGGYLILHEGCDCDSVAEAFQPVSKEFIPFACYCHNAMESVTMFDCWKALCHVRHLGWLDLSRDVEEDDLTAHDEVDSNICVYDVDEYIHYASEVNGGLHFIVPGKLVVFPTPALLAEGEEWEDTPSGRRFSASFYADLFASFKVSVVISLDDCAHGTDAFTNHAIGVEVLSMGDNGALNLEAIDRFLSLLVRAPGIVAVHGSGERLGMLKDLITSHLVRHAGFDSAAAAAWVLIACPRLVTSPSGVSSAAVLAHQIAQHGRQTAAVASHYASAAPSLKSTRCADGSLDDLPDGRSGWQRPNEPPRAADSCKAQLVHACPT